MNLWPILVALAIALALVLRRARQIQLRRRHPRDYAHFLLRQAPGPDYYSYVKDRIPRVTPQRYQRLLAECRAVDSTLSKLVQHLAGQPFSSTRVQIALQQLYPFLKHEGLRQAVRVARKRHAAEAARPRAAVVKPPAAPGETPGRPATRPS